MSASATGPATVGDGGVAAAEADAQRERLGELRRALAVELVGHEALVERLLIALLTGGHVLLEGPPGVAKTRTVKRFAARLDLGFVRVQATPDLLPADITGTDVFDRADGAFRFVPGPVFHHVVLVDEINRAPPKVQSALLEAMGERQVTVGGVTRALAEPFLVAATQNPIEHEGTYPLPEAQLDRFMFFLDVPLPDLARERRILDRVLDELAEEPPPTPPGDAAPATPAPPSAAIADAALVLGARATLSRTFLSEAVRDYVVRLVGATRGLGAGGRAAADVLQPASPRGSINLALAARARAWLDGRDFALPEDVDALAADVLAGRIALEYRARAEGADPRALVERIVEATPKV